MAQAPDYVVPTVSPEMPNQPQASPADFGAQVGEALQGVGQQFGKIGDVLAQHAMWRAQIEADTEKNEGFTNNFKAKSGIESNFYTIQGKAAQDALPGVMQQFDEINKSTLNGIQNPKARVQLQEDLARQDVYTFNKMSQHAASQSRQYADQQAAAKSDLLINSAPQADNEFDHNIEQIKAANSDRAKVQGWSPEQETLQNQLDVSRAWSSRVLVRAQTQPDVAYQMYQDHKDQFTPEARLTVERSLAGSLNGLYAKQLADQAKAGAIPNGPAATDLKGVLAARESGGNYSSENTLGFAGRYQFGAPRLDELGLYTVGPNESLAGWNSSPKNAPGKWTGEFHIPGFPEVKTLQQFLASPGAQEKAWEIHDAKMEQEIKQNHLDRFEGQTVQGVLITHDGIKAMMHLGGIGGARDALTGHGGRDDYGTTVLSYARLGLSAQANPRIAAAFGDDPTQGATPQSSQDDLEKRVAWVREQAHIIAPDDATLADNAENIVRADQNRIWAMQNAQEKTNYERVLQEAVPMGDAHGPTSVDQLSEAAKTLYYQLAPEKRDAVNTQFLQNAKQAATVKQPTEASFNRYHELRGLAMTDPVAYGKVNIPGDPDLTNAQKTELIRLQTNPKPPMAPRFDMSQALQPIKPALNAAGLLVNKNMSEAVAKQARNDYAQFVSRYTDVVKQMTEKNRGVLPGDDELQKVAATLLRNVTMGKAQHWWQDDPTEREFKITIDQIPEEDRFYIIQGFQKKFGATPDNATVIELFSLQNEAKP